MAQESFPEVALPADCTAGTDWHIWDNSDPHARKFRAICGKSFGDKFPVRVVAMQYDDGSVAHATCSIESQHHRFAPGCLDAADACQVATNLLEAANEIDRLNRWTGE